MNEQSQGQLSFAAMARHLEALGAAATAAGPGVKSETPPDTQAPGLTQAAAHESPTRRQVGATQYDKERT